MKNISFFGAFLLFITLSACSSGSSNEPDSTTSTNTVPPSNSTTDAGTSTEPSDDQPTNADDINTNGGGTDTNEGVSTDGGANESDDTSDAGETSDGGDSENNGGSDSDNTAETDSSGDSEDSSAGNNTDGSTEIESTDTNEGGNTEPAIDPDSALGQLQYRIKKLNGRTLIALNQSLSQGEMLSEQQEQCLGTYDPAIGEPLLAIDCEQPLATGEVPIFSSIASFDDTPECRASLQNANADACSIDQAEMTVNPIFTVPETGRPLLKQAGAKLSYNIVQDRFTFENLTPALGGMFFCEYDLTNGNAIGGDPGGNCYNQVNRICDLIDEHLAIEN